MIAAENQAAALALKTLLAERLDACKEPYLPHAAKTVADARLFEVFQPQANLDLLHDEALAQLQAAQATAEAALASLIPNAQARTLAARETEGYKAAERRRQALNGSGTVAAQAAIDIITAGLP